MLHWGDLGSRWRVNRSVSQIHALLYLSDRPLSAEEIAERLGLLTRFEFGLGGPIGNGRQWMSWGAR